MRLWCDFVRDDDEQLADFVKLGVRLRCVIREDDKLSHALT